MITACGKPLKSSHIVMNDLDKQSNRQQIIEVLKQDRQLKSPFSPVIDNTYVICCKYCNSGLTFTVDSAGLLTLYYCYLLNPKIITFATGVTKISEFYDYDIEGLWDFVSIWVLL